MSGLKECRHRLCHPVLSGLSCVALSDTDIVIATPVHTTPGCLCGPRFERALGVVFTNFEGMSWSPHPPSFCLTPFLFVEISVHLLSKQFQFQIVCCLTTPFSIWYSSNALMNDFVTGSGELNSFQAKIVESACSVLEALQLSNVT